MRIKSFNSVALIIITIVLCAAAGLFFYKLGAQPFQDYDEATYAEVTTESFANHDFMALHFLDVPYFRKPPLLFWLMGVDNRVIHSPEVADRIPSALSGFLLIGVVMVIVYAATGNGFAAAFGGGALLATMAFVEPARQVRFDTLVTFFDVLAVYAFYRALSNRKWFLWLGAFIGLAFMSKGPLILYAIVPSLVFACVYRSWHWLKDPYFWGGVGIAALIVLPWHIFETIKYGMAFWNEYVGVQVYERVTQVLYTVPTTNATYFNYLFVFASPWIELCIASLVLFPFLLKRCTTEERAWYLASIAGVATVLAVCFSTHTKATTYLIPLYPFVSIAVAITGHVLMRNVSHSFKYIFAIAAILITLGSVWTVGKDTFAANPKTYNDVALAAEEKNIGQYLRNQHAQTFYVYDTTTLGSIMYYSGIVQPPWITDKGTMPAGDYLLYQTNEAGKLAQEYPALHLTPVVYGSSLTLAKAAP